MPEKYTGNVSAIIPGFTELLKSSDPNDLLLVKTLLKTQEKTSMNAHEAREKYLEDKKLLEKQMLSLGIEKIREDIDNLITSSPKVADSVVVTGRLHLPEGSGIKEAGEELRKKLTRGAALVAAISDEKFNLICAVSDDLVKSKDLNAGQLVSDAARELGGGGGGRPNLATAGAKDISKLDSVLLDFSDRIKKLLT